MTALELTQIAVGFAIVIAAAALILMFMLNRRVKRLLRQQRVIMGSAGIKDIVHHVTALDEKVDNLRTFAEELSVSSKDHEARIDGCLSGVGIVRFDAYHDLGGQQSTSVAFVDAARNGVVVTTVVSREFARMYVKSMKNGRPDVALAPEEIEAFEQAQSRGNTPFTIRPRPPISKVGDWPHEQEGAPGRPPLGHETETSAADTSGAEAGRQTLGWPKLEPSVASSPKNQEDDTETETARRATDRTDRRASDDRSEGKRKKEATR